MSKKITPDNVTHKQATNALAVLEAYGLHRIDKGSRADCPRGHNVGMALGALLAANEVADASFEALQDQNGHLAAAAIDAIERGRGEVSRKGRTLTIVLPEHWADPALNGGVRPLPPNRGFNLAIVRDGKKYRIIASNPENHEEFTIFLHSDIDTVKCQADQFSRIFGVPCMESE